MKENSQEQLQEFSSRLRKAMSDMHMNSTDLVKATGIEKSNISHYRHGKYLPKHGCLYKIASALKVSPAWLLAIDDDVTADIRAMDARREEINKGIAELRRGYEEFDREMKALKDYLDCLKRAFDELDRLRGEAG